MDLSSWFTSMLRRKRRIRTEPAACGVAVSFDCYAASGDHRDFRPKVDGMKLMRTKTSFRISLSAVGWCMKLSHRYTAVGFAALLLGITGCSHDQFPSYSASIKYPLRTDPILREAAAKLGDERFEPDTPGQLPLMKF